MKIIAFTGRAGAGKDTAAKFLSELTKYEKLNFSDPLKLGCKYLFGFTDEQLYDTKQKEQIDYTWKKSPREILQWLGTDVLKKNINDDFFLIHMKKRIEQSKSNLIIITDLRFDNEAELIKELGGIIIKLVRNTTTTEHTIHSSEQGISQKFVDYEIINNSTLDDFQQSLQPIFLNLIKED